MASKRSRTLRQVAFACQRIMKKDGLPSLIILSRLGHLWLLVNPSIKANPQLHREFLWAVLDEVENELMELKGDEV